MLSNKDAVANVATRDLATARRFYEETLGLKEVDRQADQLIVFKSGSSLLNVYVSQFAGTNKATAVTWNVGEEIGSTVEELKAKGVTFERYDMPGLTLEGDIYAGYGMKVAWFKDPDGNILNVIGS
jgi:catechol 2,3-dioxygenase-like lactoylglutathione lyase family enzyme